MTSPAEPTTPATIRSLFQGNRQIDRPIEKVIDYYVTDARRLRAEIEEYEVTESVERNFRRFLDVFGAGVRAGQVTETGIWVSGFYGSGKSSFTKYLGFALDPTRTVDGRPFLDFLSERINAPDVRAELRTLAALEPVSVIMLDLGSEQLASSATTAVSTVLYWKVLQWAGYSKEEKLANLELRLERDGQIDAFREAYAEAFPGSTWESVHDDPLTGVARADSLVPRFLPDDFPTKGIFRSHRFSLVVDVRDQASEIIRLVRRRSGRQNILFLIDEVGQYVAPRGELILNLDGLARNLKELGQGRVWLVGTGQQTLSEIVQRAAYNSAELNKLRERFPIPIDLDARDIREITWRRLLAKSAEGESVLQALFRQHGQAVIANTRVTGSALFKGDPDETSFVKLYPFLPQHFDLLLELVRTLARSTGGIGLRSAIRVIQDLLIDATRALPPGTPLLANAPIGRLATVDQFFDTLRADIGKGLPHVIVGVDRVARAFPGDGLAVRAAKAVAALQAIENFPRTAENLAALLYSQVGSAPNVEAVRDTLRRLVDARELGLIEDPQTGGYAFLSEGVKPLRDRRNAYLPTSGEISQLRSAIFRDLFDPAPQASLMNAKAVRSGVRIGQRGYLLGDDDEVQIQLELTEGPTWDARRTELLGVTVAQPEWKTVVAWLFRAEESVDDLLVEIIRSREIRKDTTESESDRDVSQFLRAERRSEETNRSRLSDLFRKALMDGTLIFRGKATPAAEAGSTLDTAAKAVLQEAAALIYPSFRLAPIRPTTDLAAKFLEVERLDRVPSDVDPLKFVITTGGQARVDRNHATLVEALRAFRERLTTAGTGRIQGSAVQDLFAAAPYGWSKDATRYAFAALLRAGEVELHTTSGAVRTASQAAVDALRSTLAFNRVGASLRGAPISPEALDRAAVTLETLFGVQVLPLEEHVCRTVRERLPARMEEVAPLVGQLRVLQLPGVDRATTLSQTCADLLRDDGGAAIAILGAPESTVLEDLEWARAVSRSLEAGAVQDIEAARTMVREVDELAAIFSHIRDVLPSEERAQITDALQSERFHERLADLRTSTRRVVERVIGEYRSQLVDYDLKISEVRNQIQRHPAWGRITDEDRGDFLDRLAAGVEPNPREGQEIIDLRFLLFRRSSLAQMEAELVREIERRDPLLRRVREEPLPFDTRVKDASDGTLDTVERVVDLAELAQGRTITTIDELEVWLEEVRTHLAERLPVRLEASSDTGMPVDRRTA